MENDLLLFFQEITLWRKGDPRNRKGQQMPPSGFPVSAYQVHTHFTQILCPFYPNFVPILLKFGTYFEIILEQTSFHSTNLKWPQNLTY